MKKLFMIIALVIICQTSALSQKTLPVQTQFQTADSTLAISSSYFGLHKPIKVRFNDKNAVLISEAHMDSINLKYLRFDLIFATNQSLYAKINLQENQLRGSNLEIEKYKQDNSHLRNIIKIDSATAKKDIQILENEKLYYKQKSKGKPLVFLAGFSIGTIAVFLLKLL